MDRPPPSTGCRASTISQRIHRRSFFCRLPAPVRTPPRRPRRRRRQSVYGNVRRWHSRLTRSNCFFGAFRRSLAAGLLPIPRAVRHATGEWLHRGSVRTRRGPPLPDYRRTPSLQTFRHSTGSALRTTPVAVRGSLTRPTPGASTPSWGEERGLSRSPGSPWKTNSGQRGLKQGDFFQLDEQTGLQAGFTGRVPAQHEAGRSATGEASIMAGGGTMKRHVGATEAD